MLLCVFRNPDGALDPTKLAPAFTLLGYDLIEDRTGVSSVTNSRSFTAAFPNAEISECGLIRSFDRAKEMQEQMPRLFPADPHASCSLWAVSRLAHFIREAVRRQVMGSDEAAGSA